jgi:predicted ATPase
MLTKLRLKNFKSWEDTGEMRLAPFTGLFGTNSSGKSSILQALLLLKQTAESFDRNQVLNFGNDVNSYIDLGTFHDIVHSKDASKNIGFEIEWGYNPVHSIIKRSSSFPDIQTNVGPIEFFLKNLSLCTQIGLYEAELKVKSIVYKATSPNFENEEPEYSEYELKTVDFSNNKYELASNSSKIRNIGHNDIYLKPVKNYGFPLELIGYYKDAYFLMDFANEYEKQIAKIHYLGPLRDKPKRVYTDIGSQPKELGTHGEATISALLASRKMPKISRGEEQHAQTLEEIVAHWLKRLGLVESFRLKPLAENRREYEVLVKRYNDSTEVLLGEIGFGVSQILPVVVLCYYAPPGSTIILEQPELHLHPAVQNELADFFIEVIKTRNIQLIVESHSEHLIDRLQRRIAEEVITKDETALYFCRAGEGRSEIEELQLNEYGEINNWPEDFFGEPMGDLAARTLKIIERQQAALAESQKVAASS